MAALPLKPVLIIVLSGTMALASHAHCFGQTQGQTAPTSSGAAPTPELSQGGSSLPTGSVSGTVVDQTGAVVAGAKVGLRRDVKTTPQEALCDEDGHFSFANVIPGDFQIEATAPGFASQSASGTLHAGEIYTAPPIALSVGASETDVQVTLSAPEVAEAQLKDEEKQRVLRVIPNFYVTYDPHPMSLTARQKFELAWKTTIDPFTFGVVGAIAGIQQAQNDFSGYGQGAQGYAKRYGASYANVVSGTFLGSAIFPSLLKQDPRYFYKGVGSMHSRLLYAVANAVVCKGDNGNWQANYSNILGNLAAGGISNLYYPAQDRSGTSLTFENALIGIGATGAANIFQEFFVKKFTHGANHETGKAPAGSGF